MTPTKPAIPPAVTEGRCPARHFDHWDQTRTTPVVRIDYVEMLADHPITWSDQHGGFWILSHYDDVKAVLSDHMRFSSASGVFHPQMQVPPAVGLEQDPPEHTPFRRMYAEWLNPRLLRRFHPMIDELTERYVGEFAEAGGGDFVAAVSAKLPVQIMARTLGIDPAAAVAIYEATDRASSAADPETAAVSAGELFGMCRAEVGLRRRQPRDDFLTGLIDRLVADRPVSDEALVAWLVGAVFAGHETTLLAGAGQIHDLARDPALQQRLRAQPELVPSAVEESLRLNSPVQRFFRTLTEDVEMHGVTMRAGDKVMVIFAAANIDPARFPDPLQVDVERDFTRHLGFGWGVHRCVGASLALHELRVLTEVMLRSGEFTPAGEPRFGGPAARGSFIGLRTLPLSMSAFRP